MTDATCFLVPPEPDAPFDHSRKVVASLRIATKFKLIAKMAPHKYGDVTPALAPPEPEPPRRRQGHRR
jgi:hypothetical protein